MLRRGWSCEAVHQLLSVQCEVAAWRVVIVVEFLSELFVSLFISVVEVARSEPGRSRV